jgi:pyrroline-5-carboxylate reductase
MCSKEKYMATIGFIGSGNMAEALIKGIVGARVYLPQDIFISDVLPDRLDKLVEIYGVQRAQDNGALASTVDTVILSVKPQVLATVLEEIKNNIGENCLIVSIAAGKRTKAITDCLGDVPVVRVMPNTPSLVGEGASALYANKKAQKRLPEAIKLFSAVGRAVVVDDEDLIDAVTAVSGSGPAYYFLLMEEMIKAGIEMGLPADVTRDLVLQTAKGAAMLALEADKKNETPADLRRKVTSPKGTTEAALEVFTKGNFGALVNAALNRACQRSKELSN